MNTSFNTKHADHNMRDSDEVCILVHAHFKEHIVASYYLLIYLPYTYRIHLHLVIVWQSMKYQ